MFLDSLLIEFFAHFMILLDVYTNFICIMLDIACFNAMYWKICCLHTFCTLCWRKITGNPSNAPIDYQISTLSSAVSKDVKTAVIIVSSHQNETSRTTSCDSKKSNSVGSSPQTSAKSKSVPGLLKDKVSYFDANPDDSKNIQNNVQSPKKTNE